MINNNIIVCGGLESPYNRPEDKILSLSLIEGESKNVTLRLIQKCYDLLAQVDPVFYDLCDIAAYVYVADQCTSRGGKSLVNDGERWRRNLVFHIPVRQLGIWQNESVKNVLTETLDFLSDDYYDFNFAPHPHPEKPPGYFDLGKGKDGGFDADEIILFSGGLDSTAGVVEETLVHKKKVVLVSHYAAPKTKSLQDSVSDLLIDKVGKENICFLPILANKIKGLTKSLLNQSSRSFLFLTLAATIAHIFDKNRIRFYENGVTSFNLPLIQALGSTRSSRTTHPKVLSLFSDLLQLIFQKDFKVENPFIWKTKKDIFNIIGEAGFPEIISETKSCSHTISSTKDTKHCGSCSQCVDRKFGAEASSYKKHEESVNYDFDIFTDSLPEGEIKTLALSYVAFYRKIGAMDEIDFVTEFGAYMEFASCLGLEEHEFLIRLFSLHKEQSKDVKSVIAEKFKEHIQDYFDGNLAQDCLLVLARPDKYKEKIEIVKTPKQQQFVHSDDFRFVKINSKEYNFTSGQAEIVQLFFEQHNNGITELSQDWIITELDLPLQSRLRDKFRNHPAWGEIIVPGKRRGMRRLKLD